MVESIGFVRTTHEFKVVGALVMRSKSKWISHEQLSREMSSIRPVLFKWHWIPQDENELPFRWFCYYTL